MFSKPGSGRRRAAIRLCQRLTVAVVEGGDVDGGRVHVAGFRDGIDAIKGYLRGESPGG